MYRHAFLIAPASAALLMAVSGCTDNINGAQRTGVERPIPVTDQPAVASPIVVDAAPPDDADPRNPRKPRTPAPPIADAADPPDVSGPPSDRPVIVQLQLRDHLITISASPQGPRYSVTDRDGRPLVRDLTLDRLRSEHPEFYRYVRGAYAGL